MKKHAKKIIVLLLAVAMIIPTIAMLYSSAASYVYPVELGFNNLFIFEDWSRNKNSTTVVGATSGTLTTDVDTGSFTITKSKATSGDYHEVYTGHGMDKTNAISNMDYYKMSVEPNTTYCLSYNLGGNVTPANFFTTVFMFDSNNLCKVWTGDTANNTGSNKFIFTTPADVALMQIRFGINDSGTPNAKVSNISLSECDVVTDSTNLFNFDTWAGTSSATTVGGHVGGGNYAYTDGTVDRNTTDDTIQMNLKANGTLFTGFSLAETDGYYMIPVSANTSYVLSYNLVNTLSTDFKQFTPYIVTVSTSDAITYVEGLGTTGYGQGSCVFTTNADTKYISPVFTVGSSSTDWKVTIKDIKLMAATVETNTMSPHRLLKTYGEDETYGTTGFPEVTAPEGYIFAGWYTNEDGTGMRITANTAVQPKSLTVYPNYERQVDTLTIKTPPSKTVYTVGEKLDTTGLVLTATVNGANGNSTLDIASGYHCTPEVLNTVGTQTITANYGGKTATFTVTVKASDPGIVVVNGVSTEVAIANNEYTFNLSTSAFNRYEVTYKSDSYVSGVATFNDGKTEEFFLEPSESGHFASYINDFLKGNTYNQLVKIKFTTLDKEFGEFELISLNTVATTDLSKSVYMSNHKFEMGIALDSGGVVSELYDVSGDVYARTYSTTHNYNDGKGNVTVNRTQVDYKGKLDENYGSGYNGQSTKVNLINTYDQGRFLQQSYYGSGEHPYVQSEYNNAAWPYNPVQGGNVIGEASKIIDYKVTDEYIYVKARPLDWAKWSDDYYEASGGREGYEPKWGDDYITDTYVEAWYYFQGDTIKVTNRKVDYSGLADNVHSQEFPALYLIEPLNHFVYNNVSKENAWATTTPTQHNISYSLDIWKAEHPEDRLVNLEEPEYWGLTQMYINDKKMDGFEPWVNVNENWAAFTASEDTDSFGVGIYTDVSNKFYYGVQPAIYQQTAGDYEGSVGSVLDTLEYRHSKTTNPAPELPTAYIAPTDTMTFRSYEPTEFTYYLATGTAEDIREDFRVIADNKAEEEAARPKIAVPETVYMTPADGNSKIGQYYVNNIMNPNNYYSLETEAERDAKMYLGFHVENAKQFSVDITNVDEPSNDIYVGNADGSGNYEYSSNSGNKFDFTNGTVEFTDILGLHFSGDGLEPGEKATAKWEITIWFEDGSSKTYTAYTVMYAPGRTVGAVAEARRNSNANNELSSWITGANGVDHSQRAPLGSFKGDYHDSGRFIYDPLVYTTVQTPAGAGSQSEDDYIITTDTSGTTDDYGDNAYVLQTAPSGEDDTRSQSYLGLLAIDKSRYTNTDQIPNLRIGWDALRVAGYPEDSFKTYNTYYTLGTIDSFVSTEESETPIGWTTHETFNELKNSHSIPYRSTLIPSYTVSDDIDGKYIHAIAYGRAYNTSGNSYSTAGTSVLISLTDKSELRDTVTKGYGVIDDSTEFNEALKDAATILGDPSASQEEIDRANDALSELLNIFYALKYDNLFSAYEFSQHPDNMKTNVANATVKYENATITVNSNGTEKNDVYTTYNWRDDSYLVKAKPNTAYVYEFDVVSDKGAQAFLFFYGSTGSGVKVTDRSVQVNSGNQGANNEDVTHFGVYPAAGTNHYVIRFTTGSDIDTIGFRFGNNNATTVESTFSNIRLVEATNYYADVTYAKTEDVYKEYVAYGALQVPVRNGYTFKGWFDAAGNSITAIDTATEHRSIFSEWDINTYTITYNANGGSVSPTSQTYKVTDTVTLPTPTRNNYNFQGWKVTVADGSWALDGICPAGAAPAGMYGNVTLTAQWEAGKTIALKYDNLFSVLEFSQKPGNMVTNQDSGTHRGTVTVTDDQSIVVTNTVASNDVYNAYANNPSDFYMLDVKPSTEYVFEYDVDTTNRSQVFLFFYNGNDGAQQHPTNQIVEFTNSNGVTTSDPQPENDYLNYHASTSGHVVFKFKTHEKATRMTVRFGNSTAQEGFSSTFSNIRFIEAENYDSEIIYTNGKTEDKFALNKTYEGIMQPTKPGYTFMGWNTAADGSGDTVTESTVVKGHLTVYSQWQIDGFNVTFDNMFDLDAFNVATKSDLKITEKFDTGFTMESLSGNDSNTGFIYELPVESGKTYILSADFDFTAGADSPGKTFDMYLHARTSDNTNDTSFELDTSNGAGVQSGWYMNNDGAASVDNLYIRFTAGDNTDNVLLRFDANGIGNVVTVSNIRFYEDIGITVSPVNKHVQTNQACGELPVPTRAGYTFVGWYDKNNVQITSTSILNSSTTVFLTSRWVVSDTALVKDNVVIDFATPVTFAPLTNDTIFNAENGTKAIVGFSKDGVNYANTLAGNYGTFSFSGTNVTYTPSAVVNGVEDIYYHASLTVDGSATVVKNKITVAPASNILYEETAFTAVPVGNNAAWTPVGNATNKAQSNDDVYGYDKNNEGYNKMSDYSNGSAYKVTVSSASRSSQIMKFEFTGTGFDLNSVCGPTTGVFVVSVKNNTTGKFLPAYVVDTYYSDSKFITDTNSNLYQVPVIHETGLDYGSYTIQVASSYLPTYSGAIKNLNNVSTQAVDGVDGMTVNTASVSDDEVLRATLIDMGMEEVLEAGEIKLVWFDENSVLNGGMGVNTPAEDMLQTAATIEIPLDNYIDSVRVYKPIQNGNSYYIPSEQNAEYYNVIGNLLTKDKLNGSGIVAYISGNSYVDGSDKYDISLESYEKHGPKDELYLTKATEAVTFKINGFVKDGMKVMVSLRAASGTPTVKIGEYQFDVISNTEMYYNITDYIGDDGTVVIQNMTANTLLSIGSLKITSESMEPASISSDVDLEVARVMMFAVARDVEPNTPVVPEEPEVPEDPTEPDEPTDDNGTTDEPTEDNNTADDSDDCWFIRLLKRIIEMFVYIFNIIKDLLGF